jgi:hypothetical protein
VAHSDNVTANATIPTGSRFQTNSATAAARMTKQVVPGDKPKLIGMSYLHDSQQGRVKSTAVKTRSVGIYNGEPAIAAMGIT